MQIQLKIRSTNQCCYIESAHMSVQPDNDNKITLVIEGSDNIVTLPLSPAIAIELADALETQVQKMGGVL